MSIRLPDTGSIIDGVLDSKNNERTNNSTKVCNAFLRLYLWQRQAEKNIHRRWMDRLLFPRL